MSRPRKIGPRWPWAWRCAKPPPRQLGYDSVEALGEALQEQQPTGAGRRKGCDARCSLQTAQQEAAETALDDLVSAGTITREEADSYLVPTRLEP